jgi:hypothetical protein
MSPHTKRRALAFTLLSSTLSVAIGVAGLALYHRQVIVPAQRIGLVDLAEVYRQKEAEFTKRLTQARGEDDRQAALAIAQRFAGRLPQALAELPHDCGCLVLLRQGVVGAPVHSLDLTPLLQQKLEAP